MSVRHTVFGNSLHVNELQPVQAILLSGIHSATAMPSVCYVTVLEIR
jgi:hypothetical protein